MTPDVKVSSGSHSVTTLQISIYVPYTSRRFSLARVRLLFFLLVIINLHETRFPTLIFRRMHSKAAVLKAQAGPRELPLRRHGSVKFREPSKILFPDCRCNASIVLSVHSSSSLQYRLVRLTRRLVYAQHFAPTVPAIFTPTMKVITSWQFLLLSHSSLVVRRESYNSIESTT